MLRRLRHQAYRFIILNMTDGARLLVAYLERNHLSNMDVVRAVGGSRSAVHYWRHGGQRPKPEIREALESWTAGAIPASAWMTKRERAAVAAVKPFATPK